MNTNKIYSYSQRFLDAHEELNQELTITDDHEVQAPVSLEDAIEKVSHFCHNIEKMLRVAKESSPNEQDGLTQDQLIAIQLYAIEWPSKQSSLHTLLNKYLRSCERETLKPWFPYLNLLVTALKVLPSFTGNVWRITRGDLSTQYLRNHTWYGFSSCTRDMPMIKTLMDTDEEFTLFSIQCMNGKSIKNYTYLKQEEILLLPNFHFHVVRKWKPWKNIRIIQLQEIQNPSEIVHSLLQSQNSTNTRTLNTDQILNTKRLHLVWIDRQQHQNNTTRDSVMQSLRSIHSSVSFFQDANEFMEFLQRIPDEKCILITSGGIGKELVPKIHSLNSVYCIFVFCGNAKLHEKWISNWYKIKHLYTIEDKLYQGIRLAINQYSENDIEFDLIANEYLAPLEPIFVSTKFLKDTLLELEYDHGDIQHFGDVIRKENKDNQHLLIIIDEFLKDYRPENAIWWFTRDSFLIRTLNTAFRQHEYDSVVDMGFLIRDLHRQLEQLHNEQINAFEEKSVTVYRSQVMPLADVQRFQSMIGGVLGFNSFLLATRNIEPHQLLVTQNMQQTHDTIVLFTIEVDLSLRTIPFGLIETKSYSGTKDEVLFSPHSTHRINSVRRMETAENCFQVDLQLINDVHPEVYYFDFDLLNRYKRLPERNIVHLLLDYDFSARAICFCQKKLKMSLQDSSKVSYNQLLGMIYDSKGGYKESLKHYRTAMDIQKKCLSKNDPNLAYSYNSIGQVYFHLHEFPKCLSFYEDALRIQIQTLPKYHYDLSITYKYFGQVYDAMKEYKKALEIYDNVIKIQKEVLPKRHPDVGQSFYDLACTYQNMGDKERAFEYFDKAYLIWKIALPADHRKLAIASATITKLKESF